MSLVTACKQSFILFCLLVSPLCAFDYLPGETVHRRVSVKLPDSFLQIDARVTVVDHLRFEVVLTSIQASGRIARFFDENPFDTDEEPHDSRHRWWKAKRLRRALAQPLYLAVSEEGFEVLGEDLEERYEKHWPHLLRFITSGQLFNCLFGWDFILQDKEVQEGLLFDQNGQTVCVEEVTDDEVTVRIDDLATLCWDRHHPLLFQANRRALTIQSFTETP